MSLNRESISFWRLSSWLRGKLYWLLTSGPLGIITGLIFRSRCFDSLGPVALPASAKLGVASAVVFGVYEYPERVLINKWLPMDCDCVELGSSIGIVSRTILRRLRGNHRLFSVEASRGLLKLAERNVAAAGYSARFHPIHGAVYYDAEQVVFQENKEHVRGKIAPRAIVGGVSTPCVTLSDIITNNSLAVYSLVMDIEGSEFDVLKKDTKSLSDCRAIIAEIHGDESSRAFFVRALNERGFALAEAKHSVYAFLRRANHPSSSDK